MNAYSAQHEWWLLFESPLPLPVPDPFFEPRASSSYSTAPTPPHSSTHLASSRRASWTEPGQFTTTEPSPSSTSLPPPLLIRKLFSLLPSTLRPPLWLSPPFFLQPFLSAWHGLFPPDLLAQKSAGTKPLSPPVWPPSSLFLPPPQPWAGGGGVGVGVGGWVKGEGENKWEGPSPSCPWLSEGL